MFPAPPHGVPTSACSDLPAGRDIGAAQREECGAMDDRAGTGQPVGEPARTQARTEARTDDGDAPDLVLGPMLRYVSADAATVWVETSMPCRVQVCTPPSQPTGPRVLGSAPTFSVHGHHYALVVVEGLAPGSAVPYEVHLDGERRWPLADSSFPPSLIRTAGRIDGADGVDAPVRVVFGSCRAAAPHEPPYTRRLDDHPLGKGVDALRATGLRMLEQTPDEWPQLLLLAGDQVYADESSPSTTRRIERRRDTGHGGEVPDGVVADFEEYTWLYRESWTPDVERWLFSTVPSAMIFDDHDMIDDWNISQSWVHDIREEPWWPDHIVGGLVSYWVHQHLGNLSPERLRAEGLLARCEEAGDATELLHHWALASEEFTPIPGGYQFSFDRHFGGVHLVVMDVRNGRVLEPGARRMLDADEWAWVRDTVLEPATHVVLASSLPVFVPGGLHGIQQWNEAVCDGAWGRVAARWGEKIRRAVDLEGWPAFDRSFADLEELLLEAADPTRDRSAPSTISIVGGDIHFGYVADVDLPLDTPTTVRQVVCSPLRNILRTRERRVMRFGASRIGRRVGAWLQHRVGRGSTSLTWDLTHGPVFDNNIGTFTFVDGTCRVVIEVATLDEHGDEALVPVIDLRPGAEPTAQPGIERASRTTVPSS